MDQKNKKKDLQEQYPKPGEIKNQKRSILPENNFYYGRQTKEVRRRYMQFSVFMEAMNESLELPQNSSPEDMTRRINDLMTAVNHLPI